MSSENLFNFRYFGTNISYYRRKLFMRVWCNYCTWKHEGCNFYHFHFEMIYESLLNIKKIWTKLKKNIWLLAIKWRINFSSIKLHNLLFCYYLPSNKFDMIFIYNKIKLFFKWLEYFIFFCIFFFRINDFFIYNYILYIYIFFKLIYLLKNFIKWSVIECEINFLNKER